MADINLGVGGANSAVAGGYDIDYSVKNEQDNSERFQSTNLGTPSSTKIFTFSMWVKRTEIVNRHFLHKQSNTGISMDLAFANDSSTQALFYIFQNSTTDAYGKTSALFRDTSAWYHIVWRVDTTQATAADRVRIYVNGVQQDLVSGNGSASTYPSQNYDVPLQTTHYLLGFDGSSGFCGYCSQYYYIDGQSLAPTDFGEFDSATGIWKPIEYTGTFGNAGYYLDFADASALGKDVSPNNKGNFSHYGGSSADQATDTPTNNFCTQSAVATFLNRTPQTRHAADGGSASEDASVSNAWTGAVGTVALFKGKWYWELQGQISTNSMSGIHSFVGDTGSSTLSPHQSDNSFFVVHNNGSNVSALGKTIDGTVTYPISTGNEFTHVSIVGIALDLDNSLMTYYINGGSAGTNLTNIDISDITDKGDPIMPFVAIYRYRIRTNFGGYVETAWGTGETDANGYGNFKYSVPSGYYAICSKNLAEYG